MRTHACRQTYDPTEGDSDMLWKVIFFFTFVLIVGILCPVLKECFTPPEPNALVHYPDGSVHREYVYHRTFVLEQEGIKCIQIGNALSCSPLEVTKK